MPLRRKLDHRLGYAATVNTGRKHRKRLQRLFPLATINNNRDDDRYYVQTRIYCSLDLKVVYTLFSRSMMIY